MQSVVDYGCGDWAFSRKIDWQGATYTGLEIVSDLVTRNQRLYGRAGVRFAVTPESPEALPAGDLLVAKDVLQHLPNHDIHRFLTEVVVRYRYALITNDIGVPNE